MARRQRKDEVLLIFHYRELCLWKMEAQPLLDKQCVWLYTLLPAMKGANAALLKKALEEMQQFYTQHDFSHAVIRFYRVLQRSKTVSKADKREIEEEMKMRYEYDWFIDDNPDVIKRVNHAKNEALKEGEARGLVKGEVKGLQQAAVLLVSTRFPDLEAQADLFVQQITSVEHLNALITRLPQVNNAQEVTNLLSELLMAVKRSQPPKPR